MHREELRDLYRRVRRATEALCEPLAAEDQVVQTMPDVSPTKWHLAHVSWFFETFVLAGARTRPRASDPRFATIFNSYYNSVGDQHPRPARGHLSRPTVAEVMDYRRCVDAAMDAFLAEADETELAEAAFTVEVGLNHEEQHQELILTDLKHVLGTNPLHPAYRDGAGAPSGTAAEASWIEHPGGLVEVGDAGPGFAFDNERPRHRCWLEPFALSTRLVTAGEHLAFIEDGGYRDPRAWQSDGWDACRANGWTAPLYWHRLDGDWHVMTLGGLRRLHPDEPACHLSWYEAEAHARWAGARLPSEEEWEVVAAGAASPADGAAFLESGRLHPAVDDGARLLFGQAWQWTTSAHSPYPGYRPWPGSLGEYNGKFTCNQFVLRGGSCATPRRHYRTTYRNFFPPAARWQFTGLRLAR